MRASPRFRTTAQSDFILFQKYFRTFCYFYLFRKSFKNVAKVT